MNDRGSLISSGFATVWRNKRYIFWFWLINLTLAEFGASGYRNDIHAILDHSLYADKLLHGFDAAVYIDLMIRPEIGPSAAYVAPAIRFAFLFLLLTMIFLPGILLGYTADRRIPRDEFFRSCGHNLWRFVRLTLLLVIIAALIAGLLFAAHHALVHAAEKSTNELLPFDTILATLTVIFLVMTFLRIWFDLAEVDVVVSDQRAVRKSIAAGWRYSWRYLGRLLATYVVAAVCACLVLIAGIWLWNVLVPAPSVLGAIVVGQAILFALLWMRFWQRASAARFYMREMLVVAPVSTPLSPVLEPPAAVTPPTVVPPAEAGSDPPQG
jgi:hypothetical protein